jgi:glycosyltransferase involved in cell wall biosynthesis
MTIVVVTDFAFVNGGAGQIALESAHGLAERGHDVILFTGVGPIAPQLANRPGLRHVCLDQANIWEDSNMLGAAARGIWNTTAERRLGELLDTLDRRQTLVHLHSWTKALSSAVARAALARDFRLVVTLHDPFVVCPTGTLFHYGKNAPCYLTPLSAACVLSNCDSRSYAHKLWRVARTTVQNRIAGLPRDVNDFIVVSEPSARLLGPLLPLGKRLYHVPNFVEVPVGEPIAVEANDAVVYVGRLSAEKGPLLLARSAELAKSPVVFIGGGPMAAAIRTTCPRAELTGWLTPDAVRACLARRARVLALPSLWFETQGLVVAEAAAMGIPSIVPDVGAARDWVDDGVSGFWFRSGDEADLSRKIVALLSDPVRAARMGRAAHARFWAHPPTLSEHLSRLEPVYEAIMGVRWASAPPVRPAAAVMQGTL